MHVRGCCNLNLYGVNCAKLSRKCSFTTCKLRFSRHFCFVTPRLNSDCNSPVKPNGITLIELLIALGVSTLLFFGIVQVYFAVKLLYQKQNELATWQDNLRLVNTILMQTIRTAGYVGCRNLKELKLIDHSDFALDVKNSIHGYAAAHLPSYLQVAVKANNDVIVIQKADSSITSVLAPVLQGSSKIQVEKNPAIKFNRWLVLSDYSKAELFMSNNYVGSIINADCKFASSYDPTSSQVGRFEEIIFFIGDTGRVDISGKPINALYKIINRGNKRELIPGIDSMHIEYGVTNAKGKKFLRYYKTEEMEALSLWSRVVIVGLHLEQSVSHSAAKKFDVYVKLEER